MSTFRFIVKETNTGFIDITATSKDEAEDMVLDGYNDGSVHWIDSTIADISLEEVNGGGDNGTY